MAVNINSIPGATVAVFALFALKNWSKLPHLSVLAVDTEAKGILGPPFSLTRSQVQYQFVIWRKFGKPAAAAASSLDDAQIRATIEARVGSVPVLIHRTFAALLPGPLAGRRPAFMPGILKAIETSTGGLSFFADRVAELKGFVVENFARRASNVRSGSLALEVAIIDSRARDKETWAGPTPPGFVASAFAGAPAGDPDALRAESLSHLKSLTYVAIDGELCTQFRQLFGPTRMAGNLSIPSFPDISPFNGYVELTLSYIAGSAVSSIWKAGNHCEVTDSIQSKLFTSFAATHSLTQDSALKCGVPVKLIVARSKGSLLFPSFEFYSLIRLIEHAYSHLLTMENVLAFGGAIISEVHRLTLNSAPIIEAFELCMRPVREVARKAGFTGVESKPLLEKVLRLFMRIRGKDAVKTLVSDLKQSALANSLRGRLAASAAAKAKKNKIGRKTGAAATGAAAAGAAAAEAVISTPDEDSGEDSDDDFDDEYEGLFDSGDIDAVDMDLVEAAKEYALATDETVDVVVLSFPDREGPAAGTRGAAAAQARSSAAGLFV